MIWFFISNIFLFTLNRVNCFPISTTISTTIDDVIQVDIDINKEYCNTTSISDSCPACMTNCTYEYITNNTSTFTVCPFLFKNRANQTSSSCSQNENNIHCKDRYYLGIIFILVFFIIVTLILLLKKRKENNKKDDESCFPRQFHKLSPPCSAYKIKEYNLPPISIIPNSPTR